MIKSHKDLDFGQTLYYAWVSLGQLNIRPIKVEEIKSTGIMYLGHLYRYQNLFLTLEELAKELPNLLPNV